MSHQICCLSESDAVLDSLEPPLKFNQLPVPLKVRVSKAEEIPGTSQPEPCQTPLYAVVNKTKRKENTRPAHIAEPGEQIKNINKPGKLIGLDQLHSSYKLSG